MNSIALLLYAPLAWLLVIAFTATDIQWLRMEGEVAPYPHLAAVVGGFALLSFAPGGRPASLRPGERAFTLAASYLLGITAWIAGLGTVGLFAVAGGAFVLRLLLGPGAMTPGRSPAYVPHKGPRWFLVTITVVALVAFFFGYPGGLAVVSAMVLTAEGLRVSERFESRRWIHALLVLIVAVQTNPYLTLAVLSVLLGALHAFQRADRRGWFLAFVGTGLLGLQGFTYPALTLVVFLLLFAPRALRRAAVPYAVLSALLILKGTHTGMRPLESLFLQRWTVPVLLAIPAVHLGMTRIEKVRRETWALLSILALFGWSLVIPNFHGAVFAAGIFLSGRWNLIERSA